MVDYLGVMTKRADEQLRRRFERLEAARRSMRRKTEEVLAGSGSELSARAQLRRQRAARRAIAEALAEREGGSRAREIASHLCDWFDEAAFLVALQLDPKRFSELEVEAGVSDVLAYVLDHVWEAARLGGFPLPCLESETLHGEEGDYT